MVTSSPTRPIGAPRPVPSGSGASGGAKRRNKAIAPYDPHFVSFNFTNKLICTMGSTPRVPACWWIDRLPRSSGGSTISCHRCVTARTCRAQSLYCANRPRPAPYLQVQARAATRSGAIKRLRPTSHTSESTPRVPARWWFGWRSRSRGGSTISCHRCATARTCRAQSLYCANRPRPAPYLQVQARATREAAQ